jgi:hypothetical protein
MKYLGDGGLRDTVPSGGRRKTSGFNHITEHPQGFRKHDGIGLHKKMITVNSWLGKPAAMMLQTPD